MMMVWDVKDEFKKGLQSQETKKNLEQETASVKSVSLIAILTAAIGN